MKVGWQMLAFHINLLPYLSTLRADHTGNKGTVMRMGGSELRLNTNQWVMTTFLPKMCNNLPTWTTIWPTKQWQLVPPKSCNLPNNTQLQAEDQNVHIQKIPALRIPSVYASDKHSSTKRPLQSYRNSRLILYNYEINISMMCLCKTRRKNHSSNALALECITVILTPIQTKHILTQLWLAFVALQNILYSCTVAWLFFLNKYTI